MNHLKMSRNLNGLEQPNRKVLAHTPTPIAPLSISIVLLAVCFLNANERGANECVSYATYQGVKSFL